MVLVSPLPLQTVRARLIEGRTSYLRAAFAFGGGGGYHVVGHVGARRVSLQAVKVGVRNSWRPVMRGRLEPEQSGSRFVGRLGWSPFVKAFSALWLGAVTCFFLGLLIRALAMAWAGEATGVAFLICLAPLGFVFFFAGLTTWGTLAGRGEAMILRSWLEDRLKTAEASVSGYRPWQE